jgi:hypothetical protein
MKNELKKGRRSRKREAAFIIHAHPAGDRIAGDDKKEIDMVKWGKGVVRGGERIGEREGGRVEDRRQNIEGRR